MAENYKPLANWNESRLVLAACLWLILDMILIAAAGWTFWNHVSAWSLSDRALGLGGWLSAGGFCLGVLMVARLLRRFTEITPLRDGELAHLYETIRTEPEVEAILSRWVDEYRVIYTADAEYLKGLAGAAKKKRKDEKALESLKNNG